jgi:acyl transferase domain-containing protein/acyl carrier protein
MKDDIAGAHSPDRRELLRNALEALEKMQQKLEASEQSRREPIAVIGVGCRLPGGIMTPEQYWEMLTQGIDAITRMPENRWNASLRGDPGSMAQAPLGGFLDGIDQFDASFFGISRREAESMDPQQRLLLEVSWEALERACIDASTLRGSKTGVFVGVTTMDYSRIVLNQDPAQLDAYTATGSALNVTAGRLAYFLGLNGPAMAIDTACSSSLVAIHLACQSLRLGEADMALAGGVNVLLMPEPFICFAKWGMMAPDGRCKTFDAAADGFVRSEGCGVLVLKRLSDARSAGDRILALVKGSAVNQDGASSGLTVPNGRAQEAVMSGALKASGMSAHQISYIEAHGTGTRLGDPIEIEAIVNVLGVGRTPTNPLRVGSVKTNIGHLESASGVAGIIKVILSLIHGAIPPHLHFNKLNPQINVGQSALQIPTALTPWNPNTGTRAAGVSSFGFSGTNAHIILEELPKEEGVKEDERRPLHLLTLSAKDPSALKDLTDQYVRYFHAHASDSIGDICSTANRGRSHFDCRVAVIGKTAESIRHGLQAFGKGEETPSVFYGEVLSRNTPSVVFLFTGQGSQAIGMGRMLYETQPAFRQALDRCDELLMDYLEKPLLSVLHPESGRELESQSLLSQTVFTQPALFALEYALAELWKSWGIEPSVVMGHSVGEYVAACVAGVFSLEDGLKLIAGRGKLLQSLPKGGAMAAVFADETKVAASIEPFADGISIAANNSPENTVISGVETDLDAVLRRLDTQGIGYQKLLVSHAFHSRLVEPILEKFYDLAASIQYARPRIDLVSNVSGKLVQGDEISFSAYWRGQTRQPVRFMQSMQTLYEQGYRLFLELGPHPILLGMGSQCLQDPQCLWLPSLRRGYNDWEQMLNTLATLYVHGVKVDWRGFERDYVRSNVSLPTYPFQRKRYWIDIVGGPPVAARHSRRSVPGHSSHPLLEKRLRSPLKEIQFESKVSTRTLPFLTDYRVYGTPVFPPTGYLEMVVAAANEAFSSKPNVLEDVVISESLTVPDDKARTVQLILTPEDSNKSSFQIFSSAEDESEEQEPWKLRANGTVRTAQSDPVTPTTVSIQDIMNRCEEELPIKTFYQRLQEMGCNYGPKFQGLRHIWRRDGEALGEIRLQEEREAETNSYYLHPVLLDCCIQLFGAALFGVLSKGSEQDHYLPMGLARMRLHKRIDTKLWGYALVRESDGLNKKNIVGDLRLLDEIGQIVVEVEGLNLKRVSEESLLEDVQKDAIDWLYEVKWQPKSLLDYDEYPPDVSQPVHPAKWLIFADHEGVGAGLGKLLEERGRPCTLVFPGDNYESSENGNRRIPPGRLEDFQRLLEETVVAEPKVAWGIVHLWSLDAEHPEEATARSLQHSQILVCCSVLNLVQSIAKSEIQTPPRLLLVTRGAQTIGSETERVAIEQAPMWGLGRVVALEFPEIWGGLIDLDSEASEDETSTLLDEILTPVREDHRGYRKKQRFVARLTARRPPELSSESPILRSDGTYMITGGLGGLGIAVARWLVNQGARHLVLIGRSGASSAAQAAVSEMERAGAQVVIACADVSQEKQIADVLQEIQSSMPALRGIIHAAGIIDDGSLRNQDWSRFAKVMTPKVQGAWNLHSLTEGLPLDFFVFFSSMASLIGSPGQGNYSAANAFLDALAHYRRARGLRAISINWGPWAEVGMAASMGIHGGSRRAANGIGVITPDQGVQILKNLLRDASAQIGVFPVIWEKLLQQFPNGDEPSLLSGIAAGIEMRGKTRQLAAPRVDLLALLKKAPSGEREDILLARVRENVVKVLKLDPYPPPNKHQSLSEMGMDSLMAVELNKLLQADLGQKLPSTLAFDYPSIHELTQYIAREVRPIAGEARPSAPFEKEDGSAGNGEGDELEQLSDEEAEEALLKELEKTGY